MAGQSQVIGEPLNRVDGRAKVTGTARYAGEFKPRGLLYAVAVSSSIACGQVKSIDMRRAQRIRGVRAILTHDNFPRIKTLDPEDKKGKPGQTFIPLQSDEIRYAGQYVALILAETLTDAKAAAMELQVRYVEQPPRFWDRVSTDGAVKPKQISRDKKPDSLRGDPDSALSGAAVTVRQTYEGEQENHNPMELSATIAAWENDRLTVYTTTQWIDGSRHVLAAALDIPEENVRVICPFVGGGFGCKGSVWPHEILAAAAARQVGRPVRLVLTRSQMFTGCGSRPMLSQQIALGASGDGKLVAITHDVINHTSVSDPWPESAGETTRTLYSCPNVKTTHRMVSINTATPCQMRAPGVAPGTWALEVAMDELAYAVKIDPIELRLRNYAERDEDQDKPFTSKTLRECYRQGAERFGWANRTPEPRSMKKDNILIGWGMATATYPTNKAKASARARILLDGTALVTSATHDLGTGTYTIMTQIAAETLGFPPERVRFDLGDSLYPEAPVSGGSQSAASVGCAVKAACEKARGQLLELAANDAQSPLAGRAVASMTVQDGRIVLTGDPKTAVDIAELLRRHGAAIDATESSGEGNKQFSAHAFGAQFVEVHIDMDLLEIRIPRIVSAFCAGRILNAKTARSQIMGAIVMGVGAAIMEQSIYDPVRRKIINDNLADYLVPVNPDIQTIDCFFVDEQDSNVNDLGCKGVGELGITGIAAAVNNAIYHATGMRIRHLPITLDMLLATGEVAKRT